VYLQIVDDLRNGQGYYAAATREQRAGDYPLKPFLTVRLPTLAKGLAALLDKTARRLAIEMLSAATLFAWVWRLRQSIRTPVSYLSAMVVLGASVTPAFMDMGYTSHELWSGELISLSLALYSPRRWAISFGVGLFALVIRELAAPYLLLMAFMAWCEGRRTEAIAWILGVGLFLFGLALHAQAVEPLVHPGDLTSPGWLGLGGWSFILLQMKWNGLLMVLPRWPAAILAPLLILGAIARRGPLENRVALVVIGYIGAFLILGRQDNACWGLMLTPLWPVCLLSSGMALRGLARTIARPNQRSAEPTLA
jgi:hypothetical protein